LSCLEDVFDPIDDGLSAPEVSSRAELAHLSDAELAAIVRG
jgi:hypothetical protein